MASFRTRTRCGRGFTIVEMLVVLAVIAILMGVMIPAIGTARKTAQSTQCLSNLRSMGAALDAYLNVCNEHFPLSSHTTEDVTSPSAWVQSLAKYGFVGPVRTCPCEWRNDTRPTSYATNSFLEPLMPGIDFDPFTHETLAGGRSHAVTRLPEVRFPDRTFWAVETEGAGFVDHVHAVGWTSAASIEAAVAVHRHLDGSNVVYTDGHAASIRWDRIQADFEHGKNPFDPDSQF